MWEQLNEEDRDRFERAALRQNHSFLRQQEQKRGSSELPDCSAAGSKATPSVCSSKSKARKVPISSPRAH